MNRYVIRDFLFDPVIPLFAYVMACVATVGFMFPQRTFLFAALWGFVAAVAAVVLLYCGLGLYALYDGLRFVLHRDEEPPGSSDGPKGDVIRLKDGRVLEDGVDFHGEHDRELIERHGYDCLNFCPSTPPEFR